MCVELLWCHMQATPTSFLKPDTFPPLLSVTVGNSCFLCCWSLNDEGLSEWDPPTLTWALPNLEFISSCSFPNCANWITESPSYTSWLGTAATHAEFLWDPPMVFWCWDNAVSFMLLWPSLVLKETVQRVQNLCWVKAKASLRENWSFAHLGLMVSFLLSWAHLWRRKLSGTVASRSGQVGCWYLELWTWCDLFRN